MRKAAATDDRSSFFVSDGPSGLENLVSVNFVIWVAHPLSPILDCERLEVQQSFPSG